MFYEKIIDAMGLPFTLIYAALIVGFAYFLLFSIPTSIRTKYWPKAIGEIVSSSLHESRRRTKNKSYVNQYTADIEYVYSVQGNEYNSKKIKWSDHASTSESVHQDILDQYPVGQQVDVFYNPEKPSVGLLVPSVGSGTFIGLLFFGLAIGTMTAVLMGKL